MAAKQTVQRRRRTTTADIKTPSARAKLVYRTSPYFARLDDGLTDLGYRPARGKLPGRWITRCNGVTRALEAVADDYGHDANGDTVLNFEQAAIKAKSTGDAPLPSAAMTVNDLADAYLAYLKREAAASTHADAVTRIKKYIREPYGALPVHQLDYEDTARVPGLKSWRDDLVDRHDMAKATANRMLNVLKAMLNHGYTHHRKAVPSDTAWRGLKGYKDAEAARKVILTDAQCQRLINVTSGGFRAFVVGFLMTGARPPSELATVRIRDFDPDARTLDIDGKTGHRTTILDDVAARFFRDQVAGKEPDDLIFTKDDSTPWGKSHQHRPWQEAKRKARLPADAVMYALRHTYISKRLLGGVNIKMLADNCGTSVRMIEKHYARFIPRDVRDQLNAAAVEFDLPATKVVSIEPALRSKVAAVDER